MSDGRYKVGFRQGRLDDHSRSDWSGDGPRPLRWSAWYPAADDAAVRPLHLPPIAPVFTMGTVARNATLNPTIDRFPVILLSHGTGGTAASIGWLAVRLAAEGFVVIGVDHHGNTASETYRPEGFLCWWERPLDLSAALDALDRDGHFAGRLDMARVGAAGFSLGGYSVIAIAGAITEMGRFRQWATGQRVGRGPREFPDLAAHIEPLLKDSAVFRASWERQSQSVHDTRIRRVVALAPAPTVRGFTPASLREIAVPVTLMVGDADGEAPAGPCAGWLHEHLPHSTLASLGRDVGHYTLLCEGTEAGARSEPDLWTDAPGVDRGAVHAQALGLALQALSDL